MITMTMKIKGMHCDGCAARITALLENTAGVREVSVSFERGQAEIRYNPYAVEDDRLAEVVEQAGFEVERVPSA